MAILTVFPASNTVAPNVFIAEQDQSFIPPAQTFNVCGIVGFASKGPINTPTLVTSARQLNVIFGFPHPANSDPYLIYAGQQYLLVANQLWVVRVAESENVADEQAQTASVVVPSAGGQIIDVSDTAGPYVFSANGMFSWALNGITASKQLVVLAGTYTAAQLATDLNLQLDANNDGIQFFATTDGRIGIETVFAYGPASSLEFLAIQNMIVGGTKVGLGGPNVTALGQGMTQAIVVGIEDRYGNGYEPSGTWDFSSISATNFNIQVVVDGTQNASIDNVVQVINLGALAGNSVSTNQIINTINSQAVGFKAVANGNNINLETYVFGDAAQLLVKSASTADAILGLPNTTAVGTSPAGVSGAINIAQAGIITGSSNSTGVATFTITAETAGIEGNATQVTITNNIRNNTFGFTVFNNGVQVESWGSLTKDQSSQYYVESYLALVSNFIRVLDITTTGAPPLNGTYDLTGGTDGIPTDADTQDNLLIGNIIGGTGLYAFAQPETIDIDILAVPGHSSTAVVNALIDVCQNKRSDCIGLVDPPFGLTVEEIVQWQNGTHPLNTVRFDSDFVALYWPWVQINDNFNNINVWAPPSGSVAAAYARNDFLAAPWYAPAGLTRGIVPGITDVFSRPTVDDRNLMYGNSNAVNPIIQFADVTDFVIWGQKTLQREPTALNRVNVRRLMFVVEKRIRSACRSMLFDQDDANFTQNFIDVVSKILREIQVGSGITDFIIQADSTINTPDVIDRNEFRAIIGIIPVKAVEFIFLTFSINRTGSFTANPLNPAQ